MSGDVLPGLRDTVATACRVLARRGLVDGILGHVSARVDDERMLVRCRGDDDRGLAFTRPADVRLVTYDGEHLEPSDAWEAPKELPVHAAVLRARRDVGAVVHAHPRAAVLCGLAGLALRPVFGAYNIPAMRMAEAGVPVYERSVLIARPELAVEMVAAMGTSDAVLLRGHGVTVAGATVAQATLRALDLEELCRVTVALAGLGASPPDVPAVDRRELPDLGVAFNDTRRWAAVVAELEGG